MLIERAIQNHTKRAILRIVRRNKENGAPKIWIEHVGVSDEQRADETLRWVLSRLSHAKLERAQFVCASSRFRRTWPSRKLSRRSPLQLRQLTIAQLKQRAGQFP